MYLCSDSCKDRKRRIIVHELLIDRKKRTFILSTFVTKQCSSTTWNNNVLCSAISVTSQARLNSEFLASSLLTRVVHENKKFY